ncbi:hypothetical protein [Streptomyces noursei]|uniref:Uncharacterized protein n=1 Tax=Streptomyces noursei TaxID=1971 RepID=A0A401R6Q9_STRNR|nr:hypothetical protein SALB_06090 [Streptomyces noursei]
MPTAIAVTSPDLALPATDRQTPAAVVLRAPHLAPLDEALAETSAVLEHHGHLIVLYSTACPPEHVRRLHTLRSVLESDRIAILPSALPPLGVAVLARQLRQLSMCGFSPGVLACAARLLAHYVHAGALLGSVSGLDRVEVDLRSHMKSWLPGVHFAVLATPQPQLLHLDRHSTQAGLRPPGFATQLAVARGQLSADWVTSALAPAWQVQGVYEARLPGESARWWGTQKLIEFAAAIPDPALLSRLVASVRREECGWCGQEVIGDRCAFCAAPLARDRAGGGSAGREPAAIAGAPAAVAAPAPALEPPPPRPTRPARRCGSAGCHPWRPPASPGCSASTACRCRDRRTPPAAPMPRTPLMPRTSPTSRPPRTPHTWPTPRTGPTPRAPRVPRTAPGARRRRASPEARASPAPRGARPSRAPRPPPEHPTPRARPTAPGFPVARAARA